ncbi:MAG: hypothetical protein J6Z22_05370 [Lachnospiraceae bacterium]|nr:hypothetical protein [Lachnospiraceae bacterium]
MYYIEDQDPILVKQEVQLDQAELKRLYQEIMAKFGGYVHRSYDGMFGPYSFPKKLEEEFKFIKDYHETPIEEGAEALGMMHFEYDEYVVPELARWIKGLLEGDVSAIDAIKNSMSREADCVGAGEREKAKEEHEKQRKTAVKELRDMLGQPSQYIDGERFRQLSEQVMASFQEKPDEESFSELLEYQKKVMACISFRPIKTLYKDKWNELRRVYDDVREFYEGTGLFEELMGKL